MLYSEYSSSYRGGHINFKPVLSALFYPGLLGGYLRFTVVSNGERQARMLGSFRV